MLATAFVAVFFGGLAAAGLYLPVLAGLPAAAIDIINAAIALFITARAWPKRLTGFVPRATERCLMEDAIVAILRSGTPLVYVTLAGVLAQRAGIWHLGLEGLMIIGACSAVLGVVQTGSLLVGLGIGIVLCVLASALLWFVIEKLRANPIIAGLGLTGLGLGGTDLAVQAIYGSQASVNAPYGLPRLGPEFGAFGVLSVLVVLMPFVVFAVWVLVRRTRWGLQLTACGEHPFAARSVGVNPSRMRLYALCLGGVLCAIGGAELSMGSLQIFAYGMTAGRGFMAFAAVIFGAANPLGATAAAFFFAIVQALGIRAQLLFGDKRPARSAAGAALYRHRDRHLDQRPASRRRQGRDRVRRACGTIDGDQEWNSPSATRSATSASSARTSNGRSPSIATSSASSSSTAPRASPISAAPG